ncbi:MAG: HlyC/CorC family transporter [Alphaproteobacteria bacterium]|nr:HlyC/CorC family transporter [Alphaproteobacteria bacterium]MBR6731017.1 HlyC/CorC family transporter [Alphaproteobacteria bacterium]
MTIFSKIKSFFVRPPEEEKVLETIEEIMEERVERGDKVLVDPDEISLLKNLFRLRDIRAGEIRIPTIDITGINVEASSDELKRMMAEEKFTRLPVYEQTLDNIIGVIHVKDILCAMMENEEVSVKKLMTGSILFVPPSVRALDLLREMQAKKAQMAIIIDEYGGTDGLITLEDLLEEIVGEIEDEHDALDEAPVLHRIGNSVIQADARILLKDLEKMIGPFMTQKEKEEFVDSVGGLVFHLAGRLPRVGEKIEHSSGIVFQVLDVDARHIKKVKITKFNKRKQEKDKTSFLKKRKKKR